MDTITGELTPAVDAPAQPQLEGRGPVREPGEVSGDGPGGDGPPPLGRYDDAAIGRPRREGGRPMPRSCYNRRRLQARRGR